MPCIRYRFTSGARCRWEFGRGGIEVDMDVEGPLTLNDQDLMVDAALDGAGLAFVFEAQVEELIAKRRLVRVLADWCPAYPGFFLYYPSRRQLPAALRDRKSTRLNSSHVSISYAVFCLKKKK